MINKILKKGKNSTISSLFAGIVIIMAMFMTVACEKEENSVADQQQSVRKPQPISDMEVMQYLPEVVDGRLVFKDRETLRNYMNWIFINQDNPEKIENINLNLEFISMKQIYDHGLNSLENCNEPTNDFIKSYPNVFYEEFVENSVIQEMQASNTFGYVLNESGIVQVGSIICRVSHNYCYNILDGDESKVPIISSCQDGNIFDKNILITSNFSDDEKRTQFSYRTAYFSGETKRVVARLYYYEFNVGLDPYVQFSAEVNSQQKILGTWLGRKLDGVWLSWPQGSYVSGLGETIIIPAGNFGGADYQTIDRVFCTYEVGSFNFQCATTHKAKDGSAERSVVYTNSFTGAY
ncbi:MAG: hypothetical protein PHE56_16235 [Bacteroidales bacterium]|nr:hypothetical protein [Bacteroidales bacterium]